jgi:hypothetical protein
MAKYTDMVSRLSWVKHSSNTDAQNASNALGAGTADVAEGEVEGRQRCSTAAIACTSLENDVTKSRSPLVEGVNNLAVSPRSITALPASLFDRVKILRMPRGSEE